MRQLKTLLIATIALVFVAGVGTGAWIGSLAAATGGPRTLDRRVSDFARALDLDATQIRHVREILYDHDQRREKIRQLTPEQWRELRVLEDESRERIRGILDEEQRREYDRLAGRG